MIKQFSIWLAITTFVVISLVVVDPTTSFSNASESFQILQKVL